MHFVTIIARNVFRRGIRSLLTITGLAVAIAAMLDLVGISWNFERSFLVIFQSKGIDLFVSRAGISNQLSSNLDERQIDQLRRIDGVAEAARSLVDTVGFENSGVVSALINGWESGSLNFRGIRILHGRTFRDNEGRVALLGRVLALSLDKKVGDTLDVAGQEFRVVGVFESESLFENGALIVPMAELQRMMGREGQVTCFLVRSKDPGAPAVAALKRRIESELDGVAATPARDQIREDVQLGLARAMAWATTAISLLIGSVGMLNTMMMSVFERTHEIGILRALGWRRKRVLSLILGESLCLGLLGTLSGTLLAILGLRLITILPTARGFIDPNLPLGVYPYGLLLGLILSLLGGLYPALRAASLDPTEAIRYE